MLAKVKNSFAEGLVTLRWFASVLGERLKAEAAVIRLLWESHAVERKRDELMRRLGERVFELRKVEGVNIYQDRKSIETLKEVEGLESEIKGLRKRASELGGTDH
jgi:hypothetical protein